MYFSKQLELRKVCQGLAFKLSLGVYKYLVMSVSINENGKKFGEIPMDNFIERTVQPLNGKMESRSGTLRENVIGLTAQHLKLPMDITNGI